MTWILWVSGAIVGIVLLDAFFLSAMYVGHRWQEGADKRKRMAMLSRNTPHSVYAWPDEETARAQHQLEQSRIVLGGRKSA